jgi:hypothetical protein
MVSEFASVQIRKTQLGSPLTRGVHVGRKRDLAVALANPFCGASNWGGSGLGGQEPPRFFPGTPLAAASDEVTRLRTDGGGITAGPHSTPPAPRPVS